MSEPVIRAQALGRRFGDVRAVEDLSLEVPPGAIFGVLGHNGAGKTTTVRLLNGVLSPTAGQARVLGLDPGKPLEHRLLPDAFRVLPDLRGHREVSLAVRELGGQTRFEVFAIPFVQRGSLQMIQIGRNVLGHVDVRRIGPAECAFARTLRGQRHLATDRAPPRLDGLTLFDALRCTHHKMDWGLDATV